MTQPVDVVKLARSMGFQIDQTLSGEQDEESGLSWRWLATMGTADVLQALGREPEEEGFMSELDAAKGALVHLTVALDALVDGPEFAEEAADAR